MSLISAFQRRGILLPPQPPTLCCLLLLLDLWRNPAIEGVCLCACVCMSGREGVHLGVSFDAISHPCQSSSPGWPQPTGRARRGSAACCHMRESAYIQCLWIKTAQHHHSKFQECLLGVVEAERSKPLPGSSLFHFSVLRCRHSHPQ